MKNPGFKLPRPAHRGRLPHPTVHRARMSGPGHTAFPTGGAQAFNSPDAMVSPDQAFGGATAEPSVPGVPAESPQG